MYVLLTWLYVYYVRVFVCLGYLVIWLFGYLVNYWLMDALRTPYECMCCCVLVICVLFVLGFVMPNKLI